MIRRRIRARGAAAAMGNQARSGEMGFGKWSVVGAAAAVGLVTAAAGGHGFVGDRFFPATVTTDDPLIADELALPALSALVGRGDDGGPETRSIAAGFEFDKVVFPKLSLGVADDYLWMRPRGEKTSGGFDNVTLLAKYEVWRSEKHEAIVSVGLETDLGGTGSRRIGREASTTFTPTVYFGKGFGDLPEGLGYLRPFAVTGLVGLAIPSEREEGRAVEWGLAVEYSLPYLQSHVKDLGLPEPLKNMIPLVEFSMESPLDRGGGGTTGTVNPGVLWESKYFQVGVEALIPINRESGDHIGAAVQLQIYIDDLFPKLFGGPIFGE